MATEPASPFTRIATAIGRGLLFLARHLFALLLAIARFIVLRAIPATWRWLRNTAFPALHRFYLWLPHRRTVVACTVGVVAIAVALLWMRQPGEAGAVAVAATHDEAPSEPAEPVALTLRPAKAAPGATVLLDGLTVAADDAFDVWIEGRQTAARRLPDGRVLALVPVELGANGWPVAPAKAQSVEVRRNGRTIAEAHDGLQVTELPHAPGTTARVQQSLVAITDGYERIFESLPARDDAEMARRRGVIAMLRGLVSEGDHSLAAVLAGTSPLIEGNATGTPPDLALSDALLASSGAAAYLHAWADAFQPRASTGGGIAMAAAGMDPVPPEVADSAPSGGNATC